MGTLRPRELPDSDMTPDMVLYDSKMNTSVFLGADVPAYQVHIVSVSLNYRF